MNENPFLLDLDSNPHPRMLKAALMIRANARTAEQRVGERKSYDVDWRIGWRFYLRAMADATGCTEDDLEAWMDRHEADA